MSTLLQHGVSESEDRLRAAADGRACGHAGAARRGCRRVRGGTAVGTVAALREALDDKGEDALHWLLDRREMNVLALIGEGNTDAEVARALKLSYEGVRSRIRRIFEKRGARRMVDAGPRARARGILPDGEVSRAEP